MAGLTLFDTARTIINLCRCYVINILLLEYSISFGMQTIGIKFISGGVSKQITFR